MKKASVILPTYNEAENIPVIIPLIFEQKDKIETHELHVLVVDDNSPDGTQDLVRELIHIYPNLHLIIGEKKGLGEAYKRGMNYAVKNFEPDLIFEMDADLQHDPALIPLFITLSNYGFSLVIGSRFAPGGDTPNFSLQRRFISLFGNWMIRFLGGLPRIHDCTSGYRCIKADLIKKCDLSFLSTRGYSFQSSLLCELLRNGARVVEIPIIFPDRSRGKSKLSFQDQKEFLLNIPKIRFRQSSEFIKFCSIGIAGVLVNMLVYIFLTRVTELVPEIASLFAIELSILCNFILNHTEIFKEKSKILLSQKLLRFQMLSVPGGLANYAVLLLLVKIFHTFDIGANFIGILSGVLINYSIHSIWKWKELEKEKNVSTE